MLSKIWFVALALLISSCRTPAPHYRICTLIDNQKDPTYFYCESTDPKVKAYSIWATDAAREGYMGMPFEDYKALLKYAKQVKKDLERCKK